MVDTNVIMKSGRVSLMTSTSDLRLAGGLSCYNDFSHVFSFVLYVERLIKNASRGISSPVCAPSFWYIYHNIYNKMFQM